MLHEHPKLTVAAVNGPAVGAGMAPALACDLRIAAESARLVTGWAGLWLGGDFGGAWFLTRLVGPSRASGRSCRNSSLDACDGARVLGLVNRVVPDAGFAEAWMAWAEGALVSGPTDAFSGMKANVHDASAPVAGRGAASRDGRMVASGGTDRPPRGGPRLVGAPPARVPPAVGLSLAGASGNR